MKQESAFNVTDGVQFLWLENGWVGLDFLKAAAGQLSLRGIANLVTGEHFQLHEQEAEPWWEMEWRDRMGFKAVITSLSPATTHYRVEHSESGGEIALVIESRDISLSDARRGRRAEQGASGVDRVGVSVTLRLKKDDPFVYIHSEMRYEGTEFTLWRWTLPVFSNLRRAGADRKDDRLTRPTGWGTYVPEPAKLAKGFSTFPGRGGYPSHSWTMPFLAFDNQNHGLYLGVHDPLAKPRFFNVNTYPPHRRSPQE